MDPYWRDICWCPVSPTQAYLQTRSLVKSHVLEQSLEQIERQFPAATVVLCGDFSQLKDSVICERTGLLSIVKSNSQLVVTVYWIVFTFPRQPTILSDL